MEFDFSRFFTAVSIYVFDFNNLRSVFNNFNKSVYFINFDKIDYLLLEEFSDSFVDLTLQFRVFGE